MLNLTPSNILDGESLRGVIDSILNRAINPDKLLLNTLQVYSTTTIAYDEAVPRGSKIEARGKRGQLVGYEDSMYRVQIPSKYKVKRTLYCQFIEEGKLAEIPSTIEQEVETFDQTFEKNTIEPRGKLLTIPDSYTIETINSDTFSEEDENTITVLYNPTAQDEALNVVDSVTENGRLLDIRQDPASQDNEEPIDDRENNRIGMLDLPIDETL